jgi:hypothetical protein
LDQEIKTISDSSSDVPASSDGSSPSEEPACTDSTIEVVALPEWNQWLRAIRLDQSRYEEIKAAREEIGLDSDRPIVMSGHQSIVFHPGILAKIIALDEAAVRTGAQAVWLVPDQDVLGIGSEPGRIRVPKTENETISAQQVDLFDADEVERSVATKAASGSIPALSVVEVEDARLSGLSEYLMGYEHTDTIAQQIAHATIEYAAQLIGIDAPTIIFASQFASTTTAFSEILDSMINDPRSCAESYNGAVRNLPQAGVRELEISDDSVELPLWGLRAHESRVAINSINIHSFDRSRLSPRGILMSAFARAHLCDFFIHGTGGWVYDRIAEDWFRDWLNIEIKPMGCVTATQRLDLGFNADDLVDLDQAIWRLHHARHTPSMMGDGESQDRKDRLVARIQDKRVNGQNPASEFRSLQNLLHEYRINHTDQLDGYARQVQRARAMGDQLKLATERTWAFVLFTEDELALLSSSVRASLC